MKSIKLAEWVSLIISIIIISAIAIYLIVGISREGDEYVDISVRILMDEAKASGEKSIVPVSIFNGSRRPAKNIKLRAGESEIEIDYLPAKGTEKVYFFLKADELKAFKVEPVSYEVEK